MTTIKNTLALGSALVCAMTAFAAQASSHREAPFITSAPKVDGTDFYLFNSYGAGSSGTVTLIANYLPLQDSYGGPNYFTLDPNALYEIHIDNSGDGVEDITFQFRFSLLNKGLMVATGPDRTNMVAVPLANIGGITAGADGDAAQNLVESYTIDVVRGDRRSGMRMPVIGSGGERNLLKPIDYIGEKSLGNAAAYASYANSFIHDITIPGCSDTARVFVGQRREGFVVNLGEIFDLVNIAAPAEELLVGARDAEQNTIADKNVTSLALEVPTSCLVGTTPVIGGWTTASLRQARVINPRPQNKAQNAQNQATNTGAALEGGAWTQVSRLGSPLVNEVVIGLPDKDLFNSTEPKDDAARFAPYVLTPTLPALLEILFSANGVREPRVQRDDLLAVFLTGVDGITKVSGSNTVPSEMLRLNTSIAATPIATQNDLGVLGGDSAGFPNGRRPVDDVVDVALRAAMGVLLTQEQLDALPGRETDPNRDAVESSPKLSYTDGARPNPDDYLPVFPYLNHPLPGSPSVVAEVAP